MRIYFSSIKLKYFISMIILNVGKSWMREKLLFTIGENKVEKTFLESILTTYIRVLQKEKEF